MLSKNITGNYRFRGLYRSKTIPIRHAVLGYLVNNISTDFLDSGRVFVTFIRSMSHASGYRHVCSGGFRVVWFKYLLLATCIFIGTFALLQYHSSSINTIFMDPQATDTIHRRRYNPLNSEPSYAIRTEGCSIPAMKPLSPSVNKYVYYPSGLKPCKNKTHALLDNNKTTIWVKKENLHIYNVKAEDKSLSCCYQAFYRPTLIKDISSSNVDDRVKYNDCIYFNENIDVQDEFVRVKCSVKSVELYQQYFLFVPKKTFVDHGKAEKPKNEPAYNVLILGIDGVSRLNFHRTMPKTISLLKSKGVVEMMGYNKVGDNTFPNLIPMTMGIKDTELKKICLPYEKSTFDNCPLVWEWFKQAGYYTAFGEDSASLGTFNYIKSGFGTTPTDYYLHTFIREVEKNVGFNKDFNTFLCMQEKYMYKVLLNYIEDLTVTLNGSRLFGFFWEITMSHDYLNYPMVMDDDYVQMFNRLEANNYLNNTIVIMVSDHGIRWGDIRSTKQGHLEERLPFLFVLVPPSFRENYARAYDHLTQNSKRLITPFDLHATLSDLVDLKTISESSVLSRSKTSYGHDRAISLFLPVPYNRTCERADISNHWCTCHKNVAVSKTSPKAYTGAVNLVAFLNEMLADHPQCSRLFLAEVLDVTRMEADKPFTGKGAWEEYTVVVRTTPGNGKFEATLQNDNGTWSLVGTASRLNLYGEQSRCIHHPLLKMYCYCT